MWIDSDAFCTVPWKNDPVQFMIENNGVIMFDNLLEESIPNRFNNIIYKIYNNSTVCKMTLNKEKGYIERHLFKQPPKKRHVCPNNNNNNNENPNIRLIHGFFHITNLDFYRTHLSKFIELMDHNQNNNNNNNCNFMCRSPCDQLAVTLPAVVYAPDKTYDMISNGFHLNIFHNSYIDGKVHMDTKKYDNIFPKYWKKYAQYNLTSAANGICPTSRFG